MSNFRNGELFNMATNFLDGPRVQGTINKNRNIQEIAIKQVRLFLKPIIDGLVWMTQKVVNEVLGMSDARTLPLAVVPKQSATMATRRSALVGASALVGGGVKEIEHLQVPTW